MTILSRLRSLYRNLTGRPRVEAELDAELKAYLQLLIDEKTRAGMSPDAARRDALVEIGGVEQVKENIRDVRSGLGLDALWQDVRFGIRTLIKTPALTGIAVISLAIGIGVNAALFSLVDRLVLTTLPVREPDRLFIIFSNNRTGLTDSMSHPDLELIRSSFDIFDGVFGRMNMQHVLDSGEGLREVRSEVVTGNYFDVLGLRPALGRFLSPEDDRHGSEFAIVVGYRFWQTVLAGDPNVLGRTVRMSPAVDPPLFSPAVFRVVGVTPEEFSGTAIGEPPDVFLPMRALPVINDFAAPMFKQPNFSIIRTMARLKSGVSVEGARAELWNRFPNFDMVARGSSPTGGRVIDGHTRKLRLRDGRHGYSEIRDEYSYSLALLMTLVVVVLVIACANLANLLLVRATGRVREIGARLALGASPGRLARQWLTESLLLSTVGGLLGIAIAFGTTRILLTFIPAQEHSYLLFHLSPRNLAFTALVTLATGLLFGVPTCNARLTGAAERRVRGRDRAHHRWTPWMADALRGRPAGRGFSLSRHRRRTLRPHAFEAERGNRWIRPAQRGLRRHLRAASIPAVESGSGVRRRSGAVEPRAGDRQRKYGLRAADSQPPRVGTGGSARLHSSAGRADDRVHGHGCAEVFSNDWDSIAEGTRFRRERSSLCRRGLRS